MDNEFRDIPPEGITNYSPQHGFWPSGLEILWKEVPESFKDLISFDDIPKAAINRGYFTVGELLALKRLLSERHNRSYPNFQFHVPAPPGKTKITQRKTSKRTKLSAEHAEPVYNESNPYPYKVEVAAAFKEAMHVLEQDYSSQNEIAQYSNNSSNGVSVIQSTGFCGNNNYWKEKGYY